MQRSNDNTPLDVHIQIPVMGGQPPLGRPMLAPSPQHNQAAPQLKTRLCKHFMEGRCQFGERCTYVHTHTILNQHCISRYWSNCLAVSRTENRSWCEGMAQEARTNYGTQTWNTISSLGG